MLGVLGLRLRVEGWIAAEARVARALEDSTVVGAGRRPTVPSLPRLDPRLEPGRWSVASGQGVSGQWPVASGQWSGGQWSVASGQWSVVRGSVASGQWPVARGSVASGQWSVASGQSGLWAGGTWSRGRPRLGPRAVVYGVRRHAAVATSRVDLHWGETPSLGRVDELGIAIRVAVERLARFAAVAL